VVTVHGDQVLAVTLDNAKASVNMPIPFTIGAWQKAEPVEITLVAGKNTLNIAKPSQAFALKDLTLVPVK